MHVGAVIPPQAISGASAHPPQAPIWLEPSGCPPGRLFHFCTVKSVRLRTSRQSGGELLDNKCLFHNILLSHVVDSFALGLASVFLPLRAGSMTHRKDAARDADVLGRWRMLAEQRLEYLTQLFESGRWRRFYGEVAFLENIREAKVAVETWRGLSTPGAAPVIGPSPIEISWS